MKNILIVILLSLIIQSSPAISPEKLTITHIGNSKMNGSCKIQDNRLTINGTGTDVWGKRDDFDFAAVPLSGNIQITARITKFENCDSLSKTGIMIRNDLSPEAVHAFMYCSPQMLYFHHRGSWRNSCRRNDISTNAQLPCWLRLIRKDDQFISQRSVDGKNWHTVEITSLNVKDTIYYGIAITSNDTSSISKAVFDNLTITSYTDSLTSEMENALIKHHTLYSKYVKDSFDILVGVPMNYDPKKSTTYPTAYHLDGGDNDDHYVIRNLIADNLIPEVITIGIGYVKSEHQRERDYTDGFDKFYLFLKNELIPFIDAHYKTDPLNRTLQGYSLGGLASMQTLYKFAEDGDDMPFCGIIAGSPSLWYQFRNGNTCYKYESKLHKRSKNLPINLYMCMGSEEGTGMVDNFKKMSTIIEKRHYKNLNLEVVLNEGLNHDSNKRPCFREGYIWLLNQPLPKHADN